VRVSARSIAVTGMTCDHCASAVRISCDPPPGDAELRRAVEEAGYEFVG